ncbi:MAG: glycosyltransferase family 4 protein [Thermoplasmata archaeon]|nr:glycosyltransferase family 4 protein [Thermoplasmata archaeon]
MSLVLPPTEARGPATGVRKRVAIVSHGFYPSVGGSERYHLFTARALQEVAEVRVFTSELNLPFDHRSGRGPKDAAAAAGVPVDYLGSTSIAGEKFVLPWLLWGHLRRFAPDLIWTNQPSPTGASAQAFARLNRIPWVATYHADIGVEPRWHRYYQSVEDRLLRRAAHVLVTSAHYREKLSTRGVNPDRVSVVPTGPYIGDGHPPVAGGTGVAGDARPGAGHPIIFLGALDPAHSYKRVDLLLSAVAELQRRGTAIHLELVGDGPWKGRYETLSEELGLSERVRFLGRVPDGSLAERLNEAWALVLSAITDAEGFGTSAVEAIHYGCPVVTSTAVPCSELLDAYHCGLVYRADEPGALAGALQRLWTEPALRAQLSIGARTAARELEWGSLMPRILAPVRALLFGGETPSPDPPGEPGGHVAPGGAATSREPRS